MSSAIVCYCKCTVTPNAVQAEGTEAWKEGQFGSTLDRLRRKVDEAYRRQESRSGLKQRQLKTNNFFPRGASGKNISHVLPYPSCEVQKLQMKSLHLGLNCL